MEKRTLCTKLAALLVGLTMAVSALAACTGGAGSPADVPADVPAVSTGTTAATEPAVQETETEPDEQEVPAEEENKAITPEEIFSDALFIGDSVTNGFRNYCMRHKVMPDAQIVSSMSYSVNHAVNDTMNLFFNGEQCSMEEAIKSSGAGHVFILLGLNDINLHDVDKYVENWGLLVDRIRAMNPDVTIYIESCTPAYISPENTKLRNDKIDLRNEAMVQFCADNDIHFIDVSTPLKDERGGLADIYTSDNFIHMSDQGYDVIVEALTEYLEAAY